MSRIDAASPCAGRTTVRSTLPWLLAAALIAVASPIWPQTVADAPATPAPGARMTIEGLAANGSMQTRNGHGDGFELYAVAFDIAPPAALHRAPAASDAQIETPPTQGPGYVTVTRDADAVSTTLREAIASRHVFPRATLTLPASLPGTAPATTVLENVTVVLVRPATRLTFPAGGMPGTDGAAIATEEVTLGFERISTQ